MIRLLKNIMLFAAGLFAGRTTAADRPPHGEPPYGPPQRAGWNRFFKRLAMLVPVLAVGGFLLVASGIVPIKASSGHWGITAWFLDYAKSRSVATHSMGISPPPLDDRALIVRGAGHFETGCRPCHGSVSGEQPRVPAAMTPDPPYLPDRMERWDPEELFYIVKHGIKFTGMPAWPALERDDEVWAVVAFLRRLTDLNAEQYRDLVYGSRRDPAMVADGSDDDTTGTVVTDVHLTQAPRVAGDDDVPPLVVESCGRCHGQGGEGRDVSAFPRLAGQRGEYLYRALRAYADAARPSGIMEPVAGGMTEEEMRELALYFSQSTAVPGLVDADPIAAADTTAAPAAVFDTTMNPDDEASGDAVARGREIAHRGIPARKVPSCVDCHGPAPARRNAAYPLLGGQYADYIVLQLRLFQERGRGGSAFAHLMHPTTWKLTEGHMRDVAQYYESLAAD